MSLKYEPRLNMFRVAIRVDRVVSSSSLLLSSLVLSDTQVYEPEIRALLGTAVNRCGVYIEKGGIELIPKVSVGYINIPSSISMEVTGTYYTCIYTRF